MNSSLLALVGAALIGASLWLAAAEYRAFRQVRMAEPALFSASAARPMVWHNALSLSVRIEQMHRCSHAQLSVLADVFAPAARTGLAQACLTRAEQVLTDTPGLGIALLAKAISHDGLGGSETARTWLAHARAAAPYEGWIARQRIALALLQAARGESAALDDGAAADVAVLLSDPRLVEGLAARVLRATGEAEWITSVVERSPEADQRRFLDALARAAQAGGGA